MAPTRPTAEERDGGLGSALHGGEPSSQPETAELVVWLTRLARSYEAVLARLNDRHDLLPSETGVLLTLWFTGGEQGVRPSVLAASLEQTTGGMTATLRRLETAGLVERAADPGDGRVSLARLTDAGRETGLASFADMTGWFDEALIDVGTDRRRELLDSVMELFSAIDERRRSEAD